MAENKGVLDDMNAEAGELARTYLVATELRLYSTLFSDAYACSGGSGHYSRPVDPRGLDPSYAAQTSIGAAILHPAQAQLNSITKILTHAQSNGLDSEQWPPPVASSANLASASAGGGCLQYSAVYVPTTNNLVGESSFSTTSTSDQALPSAHSSHYHSSRSSSGTSGGRRKNTSRCHTHRRSRQPPPTASAAASNSNNTRTISSSCSCSSCSSSCPEDKENNSQICSSPPLPLSSNVMASAVIQATVNGQESDLLWQQGGHHHLALCTMASMQNNLPVASSNGGFAYSASAASAKASAASNADVQSRQSWHKNVVVQQAEENGRNGIFSSLWRKRSRTTQNQRLANNKRNPRSPMHAASASTATEASAVASITKTGNQQHAWMTLRVPTTGAGHLENMHQPQPQQPLSGNVPVGFRLQPQQPHLGGQPPALAMCSKTLGRQPTNNNNNVNGHTVMPNPDDILPKEAWTDFSGNDEWPRFSRIAGSAEAAASASATDRNTVSASMASTMASVTDNNNSIGTRLYVNCPATSSSSSSNGRVVRGLRPDSNNDEDDQDAANGNCENSLAAVGGGGGSSALNGLRPPSAIASTTVLTSPTRTPRTSADNDDNGGQHQMSQWNEKFSQQIENNLMASATSTPLRGHRDTRRDSKKPVLVGASEDSSCSLGGVGGVGVNGGGSQGHVRGSSEMRSKPPVPPPRNCISHQRKTRTKKQQSKGNGATGLHYLASEEAIGAGGSLGGHHANDEKSSLSSEAASAASMAEADDSQDESDNDLEEKSLLFQPDSSSEWHQSPLLQ